MTHEQYGNSKKNSKKEVHDYMEDDTKNLNNTRDKIIEDTSIEGQFQDRGKSHKKDNSESE